MKGGELSRLFPNTMAIHLPMKQGVQVELESSLEFEQNTIHVRFSHREKYVRSSTT